MLYTLFEQVKPAAIVVALDAPGKTFRHADYEAYKGTRRETPNELHVQLDASRELICAFGIPCIEKVGYEADDVVGTITRQAEENGYDTTVVTGDLDSLQLVDPCVSVMTTLRGVTDVKVYNEAAVVERYGFTPDFITDYKALVGDTSDNIPGVPGIGEKTATLLIQRFGHIENLIERLSEVEEKYRKKLEPHLAQIPKSKWLATILRDAPIDYDFAPYKIGQEQISAAKRLLETYEFRSHLRRLDAVVKPYLDQREKLFDEPAVQVTQEALQAPIGDRVSLMGLRSWVADRPYALLVPQPMPDIFGVEIPAWVACADSVRPCEPEDALRFFAERPGQAVSADAKALMKRVKQPVDRVRFDVPLAGFLLQPGRSAYPMAELAASYLEVAPPQTPEQTTWAALQLEPVLRERLRLEGQERVLDEIELPLTPLLVELERRGIGVSRQFLGEYSRNLEQLIETTQRKVFELAGMEFNIGSPKQLGEVLFDKLGLPGQKKTKTGYATGAEVLVELAPTHEIAAEVLTWRELTKLKGTYADALPKLITLEGRIHTTFNQTGAVTGRISSNEPNLQNIPIRTEMGRQIRKAFVAGPGKSLASFDYSQIELRVLAHMCQDEALTEAFRTGEDVHTVTAAEMFHLDRDQVTKEQRRLAKMLNYAVLYGVTGFGLKQQLGQGFSQLEAQALIEQYNQRFGKVKAFTEGVAEEARAKGFTTTLCGRRRYFPEIHAANRAIRQGAERQAINAPIQGTAADMMKLAMLRVRENLDLDRVAMLLTVHDELVFEIEPESREALEPIRGHMESALPLDVPVEVDAKVGPNWLEMDVLAR